VSLFFRAPLPAISPVLRIIDEDQKRNKMVNALENTEVYVIIKAMCSLSAANMAKKAII
jgi:hypothetical protein